MRAASWIIYENASPDDILIVLSGRCRAYKGNQKQVFGDIIQGDLIGEITIINDALRTASVVTLRGFVLAWLSKDALLSIHQKSTNIPMDWLIDESQQACPLMIHAAY